MHLDSHSGVCAFVCGPDLSDSFSDKPHSAFLSAHILSFPFTSPQSLSAVLLLIIFPLVNLHLKFLHINVVYILRS